MGRNDFLEKQKQRDRKFFEAGMQFGMQLVTDFHQLTLHDKSVMGSRVLGRVMLEKVAANCAKLDDHFYNAFSGTVDADYLQEEMDAGLREIFGADLIPCRERYPMMKQFDYTKSRKGWK